MVSNLQPFKIAFKARVEERGTSAEPGPNSWLVSPTEGVLQPSSSQGVTVQWTPPFLSAAEYTVRSNSLRLLPGSLKRDLSAVHG